MSWERQKTFIFKGETNERINQIHHKIFLLGRVSQRREDLSGIKSSTVHYRRGGRSAQSNHSVRDTCDKSAHSIVGRGAPMSKISRDHNKYWLKCPVKLESRDRWRAWRLESASNLTNPGLGETAWNENAKTCNERATSDSSQFFCIMWCGTARLNPKIIESKSMKFDECHVEEKKKEWKRKSSQPLELYTGATATSHPSFFLFPNICANPIRGENKGNVKSFHSAFTLKSRLNCSKRRFACHEEHGASDGKASIEKHVFFGWSLLGSMSPLSGRSPFSQLQKIRDVALYVVGYTLDQHKQQKNTPNPNTMQTPRECKGGGYVGGQFPGQSIKG